MASRLATDLNGCSYTIKAVMGGMLDRGRGVILTISSIGADRSAPRGAYYVSKAGINALTLTLANEVAARGIRVNASAPGLVMTDMGERMVKWRSTTPISPAAAPPGNRVRPSASPEYWRNTLASSAPPTSAPSPTPAPSTGRSSSAPAAIPVESRTRIP